MKTHRLSSQIDNYFKLIEKNSADYFRKNMVTKLQGVTGHQSGNVKLINECAQKIEEYHKLPSVGIALEQSLATLSATEKAFYSILFTGLGTVAGALAGKVAVGGPFSSLGSAVGAVAGGGLGILGYKAFEQYKQGEQTEHLKNFKEELKEAGLSVVALENTTQNVAKLFYYREALLLGKKDKEGNNLREGFKKTIHLSHISDDELNKAIELYFLRALNQLCEDAFGQIQKDMRSKLDKAQDGSLGAQLKQKFEALFGDEKERQRCTQEMQIGFMKQCIAYLHAQKNEKNHLEKHRLRYSLLIGGLAGGIVALTLLSMPMIGLPVIVGLFGAAIVGVCVGMMTNKLIKHVNAFYFKRNGENRQHLEQIEDIIDKECRRLERIVASEVETTSKDFERLDGFLDRQTHWYSGPLSLGMSVDYIDGSACAMGADSAWIREYAGRYRESKQVEVDLKSKLKKMTLACNEQSQILERLLTSVMTDPGAMNSDTIGGKLRRFLANTRTYLQAEENAEYVEVFEIREKIKEQFLSVVARIPENTGNLPRELIKYYTDPITKGGLGGAEDDLGRVRTLAPRLSDTVDGNFYKTLERARDTLNHAMHARMRSHPDILMGDSQYRSLLGLRNAREELEEQQFVANVLTATTIDRYLQQSFEFLHSLNPDNSGVSWKAPITNSNEFIVYRTLLLRQLAALADPKNLHVDKAVQDKIIEFVTTNFKIDPSHAFDDLLNESLFLESSQTDIIFKTEDYSMVMNPLEGWFSPARVWSTWESSKKEPTIGVYVENQTLKYSMITPDGLELVDVPMPMKPDWRQPIDLNSQDVKQAILNHAKAEVEAIQRCRNFEYIARAIRVDMAQASRPITPKSLVQDAAEAFLNTQKFDKKTLFCFRESHDILNARGVQAPDYQKTLEQVIATTKKFISTMRQSNNLLKSTGALEAYINEASQEVQTLMQSLKQQVSEPVCEVHKVGETLKTLSDFQDALQEELALLNNTTTAKLEHLDKQKDIKKGVQSLRGGMSDLDRGLVHAL